jgi:hypothetical protein
MIEAQAVPTTTAATQAVPAHRISRLAVTGWVLYDLANTIFSMGIVSLFFSLWIWCSTEPMTSGVSMRTVCCNIVFNNRADRALRRTQVAFNAAATFCAQVAWDERITNKHTLHHRVYYQTRTAFGLGAQLACCARDKAAEAVRAVRAQPDQQDRATGATMFKTCPTFRAHGSIRLDVHTYRLLERDQVSITRSTGGSSANAIWVPSNAGIYTT